MATFTELLGLVQQETGENELIWGATLESSFIDLVDEAIAGRSDVDVTLGDVTLTDENGVSGQARNMIVRATGTPAAARTIFVPLKQKLYIIDNSTLQTLTVKTTTGLGITVSAAEIVVCVVDQDLNQVLKMVQHSQNVVEDAPATMTTIPTNNLSATVDNEPDFVQVTEGTLRSMGFVGSQSFTTPVSASAALVWNPQSGFSFDATDFKGFQSTLLYVSVAGVPKLCAQIIGSSFIFVSRQDGAVFPGSTAIVMPNAIHNAYNNAAE